MTSAQIIRLGRRKQHLRWVLSDNEGSAPLHEAAFNGHGNVVKVLLTTPGVDVNAADNERAVRAPLHEVALYGHENVVKVLLTTPGVDVIATQNTLHRQDILRSRVNKSRHSSLL